MARYYRIKGKAKVWIAVGGLIVVGWSFFGTSFLHANFGFFHRGYQFSFFRGGSFVKQGIWWQQHDRTLGRIISVGGEMLEVDVDATIGRGTIVVYVWRWPAFLYDEPMVDRFRFRHERKSVFRTDERISVPLRDAGLYVLSITGLSLKGDVAVDWDVR